ncbi:hypothetical protein K3U94_05430 [Mycolicibacter heraklionensis]|uniref:Uncharacterized protein n=1 Tax=Mycolicibacter heraklionensis TaxID=512402 RepID=A0A9X7WJV7_9MYCO|nr:hypothetical protein [Mycolicibacter heraklionensis]QZA08729.1 hypothetical protein K3U94_05430 [Mycolicibacter heraklionensis]
MTRSLGKRANTDDTDAVVRWMDIGAARTDPETTQLPPIQPARRRLHAAWRENAQSRIVELDVEIDDSVPWSGGLRIGRGSCVVIDESW